MFLYLIVVCGISVTFNQLNQLPTTEVSIMSGCHFDQPPPAEGQEKKIFQLKITLSDYEPRIWRCIQVPSDFTFYHLHEAIQESMGWLDGHRHEFHIKGIVIGPETGTDDIDLNESVFSIEEFFEPQTEAIYVYDLKDCWDHKVFLEAIMPAQPGIKYPRCIDGMRACPPDDCGGTEGYEELLKILADPSHPEHDERKKLTQMKKGMSGDEGYNFDPDEFDPTNVLTDWDAHLERKCHERWLKELGEAMGMLIL